MYWGPSIEQDYMKETRKLAQAPADQVVPPIIPETANKTELIQQAYLIFKSK